MIWSVGPGGAACAAGRAGEATLTVTNLGDQGVESVYGVIDRHRWPSSALAAIHDEPWAEGGLLGVRPVVHASLAADDRVTDGRAGARFLDIVTVTAHPGALA